MNDIPLSWICMVEEISQDKISECHDMAMWHLQLQVYSKFDIVKFNIDIFDRTWGVTFSCDGSVPKPLVSACSMLICKSEANYYY